MNSQFETERKKMTAWAFVVTFLYIAFLLLLAATLVLAGRAHEIGDLKANEAGDLLAGIGGPFALIWLVYGYFLQGLAIRQQAEELSQNTRALHLQEEALRAQAQELKNAVEQQRELVDVSRKQVEVATEARQYQRERDANAMRPNFIFQITSVRPFRGSAAEILSNPISVEISTQYLVEADLSNQGNIATEIHLDGSNHLSKIFPQKIASLRTDEKIKVNFLVNLPDPDICRIGLRYRDAQNSTGSQAFELIPGFSQEKKLVWLEPTKLNPSP